MITTIWQVSDTHLGAAGGTDRQTQGERAWLSFVDRVATAQPDLVVVTGDLVVDDPDDLVDQARAHELLQKLTVPYRVVPGNHDVGDHAVRDGLPADWHGKTVTSQRVSTWNKRWGADYWRVDVGGVICIGLNSQLVGSGLVEEQAQLDWLATTLDRDAAKHGPLLVFTHEALVSGKEAAIDSWMAAPTVGAKRLQDALMSAGAVTVFSGHTHRFFDSTHGQLRQVTAPSLSGPIPMRDDMTQAPGDERPGWIEISVELSDDSLSGSAKPDPEQVEATRSCIELHDIVVARSLLRSAARRSSH